MQARPQLSAAVFFSGWLLLADEAVGYLDTRIGLDVT